MQLFEPVRKALLAGLGMQEKVREFVDEMVKKGELSESDGAKLIKEWSEKADKGTTDINKSISDAIGKAMKKMNLLTKDDMDELRKEIRALGGRLKKLEGKSED